MSYSNIRIHMYFQFWKIFIYEFFKYFGLINFQPFHSEILVKKIKMIYIFFQSSLSWLPFLYIYFKICFRILLHLTFLPTNLFSSCVYLTKNLVNIFSVFQHIFLKYQNIFSSNMSTYCSLVHFVFVISNQYNEPDPFVY